MKSFDSWTFEDVQKTFGLKRILKSELLTDWLLADKNPNERIKESIENLKDAIFNYVDTWNEDEIKFYFIAPLINLINFTTERYKAFNQRNLHLKTENVNVSGRIDLMICTGLVKPQKPFFFFNEYKPSKHGINDPLGQLLIEMVTGQHLNQKQQSIYGAYTEGRFWYFVVLQDNNYAISDALDSTTNNIYKIYSILCKLKEYIEEMVKN